MGVESYGSLFEYGNQSTYSASTTWTSIGTIVNMDLPKITTSDIKNTALNGTTHVHTYQPGMMEPGEHKVVVQFTATQFAALQGLRRTSKGWRITFNDQVTTTPSKLGWDGYIKEIGNVIGSADDLVTTEVTIKVSGDFTFVPAA